MKKVILLLLICSVLYLSSCTNGYKDPIGPSVTNVSISYGGYDVLNTEWIVDYDEIYGLEGMPSSLLTPEVFGDVDNISAGSFIYTEIVYEYIEGKLDYSLYYYYETWENTDPNQDWIGNMISFQWPRGLSTNIKDIGNAVVFRAQAFPEGDFPMGNFEVYLLHDKRDDNDPYLKTEITMGKLWKEYFILIDDFQKPTWASSSREDYDYALSHNTGVGFGPQGDVEGLKGRVYIDDIRIVVYVEKK